MRQKKGRSYYSRFENTEDSKTTQKKEIKQKNTVQIVKTDKNIQKSQYFVSQQRKT